MMGGSMGGGGGNDGNNMPPPEDAPATTDALIAGGGSDTDDDDDDNDDDSGDTRDDGDNGDDTDNDSDTIPKDAPETTNSLTAKKVECPRGQEVTLFSTTCGPKDQQADTQCVEPAQQGALTPSPQPPSSLLDTTEGAPEADDESGEAVTEFDVASNFGSQCVPPLQSGQIGNLQNPNALQYNSEPDDDMTFEPDECIAVNQQAAACP